MNPVLKHLVKFLNPHLNKMLRFNRPITQDWKMDLLRPKEIPFIRNQSINVTPDLFIPKGNDLRRPYRILCLDGGGVRGVLTLSILQRICEKFPTFLQHVDFICGTSAGGILSLMLASGYTPKECHEIYTYSIPHIFNHNPLRIINPFRSKYSDKSKQEILQFYFGDRKMEDLDKTCAVIAFRLDGRKSQTHTFFDKEGWRPAVFSNMPKCEGLIEPDLQLHVWDAAMRTSAAPTFFPIFRGYTDGGIIANNPSIIAVSKAMAHFPNVNTKNISVLSLGAGNFPRHTNLLSTLGSFHNGSIDNTPFQRHISKHQQDSLLWRADWGIKQWIPFLLDLLLDGDSITTEMVMHYLLAGNKLYHRVDPRLPHSIPLDDVLSMSLLTEFSKEIDLTSTYTFVENNFFYDDSDFDNMIHNSLDSASNYHDAWTRTINT